MGTTDDRRESEGRRYSDRALLEWRGQITEQVAAHERKFAAQNGDIRDIRDDVRGLRDETIELRGEVKEARSDIGEAAAAIGEARGVELEELKDAIRDVRRGKVTTKDVWIHFIWPAVITVLGTLLLLILTHAI